MRTVDVYVTTSSRRPANVPRLKPRPTARDLVRLRKEYRPVHVWPKLLPDKRHVWQLNRYLVMRADEWERDEVVALASKFQLEPRVHRVTVPYEVIKRESPRRRSDRH